MSQANVNSKAPATATASTATATRARTRGKAKAQPAQPLEAAEVVVSDLAADGADGADVPVAPPSQAEEPDTLTALATEEPAAAESGESKGSAQVETEAEAVETPSVASTETIETTDDDTDVDDDAASPTAVRLTVDQSVLLQAVDRASAAVSRRSLPVLKNLLLRADTDSQTLLVAGYNQSIWLECEVSAEVEQSGELLIASECLSNLVGRLPDATLCLDSTAEKGWISLSCKGIEYRERISSTDNFPEMPSFDRGGAAHSFNLSAAELSRGLRAVVFAADKDETKLTHAVAFQVWRGQNDDEDGFSLIATNGGNAAIYTLVGRSHDLNHPDHEFLLPLQSIGAIEKMAFMAGTVEISADRDQKVLRFSAKVPQANESVSQISAIIRLKEGSLPRVRAALPDPSKASATAKVDYLQFSLALSRQEALKAKTVLLSVKFDEISLQTLSADAGRQITETIGADTQRQSAIPLALSPIQASLKGIESEQIEIQLDSQIRKEVVPQGVDQEHDLRIVLRFIDTPLQVMSMRVFGGNSPANQRNGNAGKGKKGKSNRR